MAKISPFEAVRPQPQLAKQVASKPYDVLNSAEAKLEAVGKCARANNVIRAGQAFNTRMNTAQV